YQRRRATASALLSDANGAYPQRWGRGCGVEEPGDHPEPEGRLRRPRRVPVGEDDDHSRPWSQLRRGGDPGTHVGAATPDEVDLGAAHDPLGGAYGGVAGQHADVALAGGP